MPNVGAPDFKDIDDKKLPKIAGAPGRSNCVSATHTIASAKHCASAPAVVTGPIAPPKIKGTITAAPVTVGDTIYLGASGQVSTTGTVTIGKALTTTSTTGAVIEFLPKNI